MNAKAKYKVESRHIETNKVKPMRYLYEVWEGKNIYFNPLNGQFETEQGFSSYVLSSARWAARNGAV